MHNGGERPSPLSVTMTWRDSYVAYPAAVRRLLSRELFQIVPVVSFAYDSVEMRRGPSKLVTEPPICCFQGQSVRAAEPLVTEP